MKKNLLFLMLFASVISYEAMGQCGRVGLIGEFTAWSSDYFMTRNPETPELFTAILIVKASDDPNGDGIMEMKFRANSDWGTNWGAVDFPSGIGLLNGANIPVPYGNYFVTFNCNTGAYNFQATCGAVSIIGEFNNWSGDEWMTRDVVSIDEWSTVLILNAASDPNGDGIVELKFRENADWAINWGAADFPSGIGLQNGANIPVPVGTYKVTFNCLTGAYNFLSTCGNIALIGEFNGWADDYWMIRNAASPDDWSVILTLNPGSDGDANGVVELKFRMNADWGTNWGAADFPSGIGVANGANIPVPLDATGMTTDYLVTFNCATGAYNFAATSGVMSMIGAFNNWNGDIMMNRDAANPDLWKLSRSWFADSEVKFRENKDWTANWGSNTFPTGTGTPNGANIPLVAGKYDVTFNATTLDYSFVVNADICGEIGMIGDFNSWGDDGSGVATDIWMIRDPMYPSNFKASYNFASSTDLWFRLDGDVTYTNVYGGTFPAGTATLGGAYISVPGGKYEITFNCKSGDFNFFRLGNGVTAPKVFNILVDGLLNESDWKIDQPVSQVVYGAPAADGDLNQAYFGVAYNSEFLYVGLDVVDSTLTPYEMGEVFIDGNKSGGAYDTNDLYIRFAGPFVIVMYPDTILGIQLGFAAKPDGKGYTAELAIPWAELTVTPAEGGQVGFDLILSDRDTLTIPGVDYMLAWNGGLQDYVSTSSFGDLNFGVLACGCISLYNTTVGDVILQNPTDAPTTYVGSYELFEGQDLVFRKDLNDAVTWGANTFPDGTATLLGPAVPAAIGRYRVTFDCISGAYTFADNAAVDQVAYTEYIDTPPVIDGDLSEYNLSYDSQVLAVGTGPINNTVTWGSRWDMNSLYLGVKVVDAVVYQGTGNPWDNDAVEYYIDGNHDRDGAFDANFDTQLIQDVVSNTTYDTVLWVKADGVPVPNFTAKWFPTTDGYNVELRLGWDNFSFLPGKGRSIGFSMGNNDNDLGTGRDYQSVWYGTASNWSNTADLGDLQLAGGPYFFNVGDVVDYSDQIVLFPNPSSGNVYLRMVSDSFKGNVTIYVSDIMGRTIVNEQYNLESDNMIQLDANQFTPGIYFVNIMGQDGAKAVKKLIIR
jgi:hypothetical protein